MKLWQKLGGLSFSTYNAVCDLRSFVAFSFILANQSCENVHIRIQKSMQLYTRIWKLAVPS